jgi:hypothetical protein
MLTRRLQVLLDEERYQRLADAASERGVSVATIVREAIDRGTSGSTGRRRQAGQRVLDAPDMPLPAVADLLAELDQLRGRRG